MNKLYCDRCVKEITDAKRGLIHHKVHYGSVILDSIRLQMDKFATWHEICIDCENSFVRWYNHPENAEAKPMDNSLIIDAVRAALEKGGQHIMIAPDGGVSIWPDDCTDITRCKDCRKWIDMRYADGMIKACELTEMATKPNDFCSYAEAMDND